jgi:hypothetical protein
MYVEKRKESVGLEKIGERPRALLDDPIPGSLAGYDRIGRADL